MDDINEQLQASGKAQKSYRLSGDVTNFLEAIAKLSGDSPPRIVEDCLWAQLPQYREKILERRKQVMEMMMLAGTHTEAGSKEEAAVAKKKGAR